jgi:hypothetical protein
MAKIKELVIRFTQSTSGDVVANRVRIHAADTAPDYATPYDEVRPPPAADADGFTRIPLANVPKAAGLSGRYDVGITAVDAAGNESDFLDIDSVPFDLDPPRPPTAGSVE